MEFSSASQKKRFLCVCDGGDVKSVALATILKLNYQKEAIPIGRLFTSPESLKLFTDWAEVIILTQPHMEESIPEENKEKIIVCDIGPDRWGVYIHPELLIFCGMYLQELFPPTSKELNYTFGERLG